MFHNVAGGYSLHASLFTVQCVPKLVYSDSLFQFIFNPQTLTLDFVTSVAEQVVCNYPVVAGVDIAHRSIKRV